MIELSKRQARRFLLLKHGLLGEHRFRQKQGALDFVRQAGCIQFDPVDACGKNAELTLQSRVRGFTKEMLHELLYIDRQLFDYPDKNLSIIPIEDWPYFEHYRARARSAGKRFAGLDELEKLAREYIARNGPVNSGELPVSADILWHSSIHWSGNRWKKSDAARSVLEQLYSTGELIIHHRKGTRKYYDLATRHIPADILGAPDPLPDIAEHRQWRIQRRIGAVGLLWNRASDAWLHIQDLQAQGRNSAFQNLLAKGKILGVRVENMKDLLYCRSGDEEFLSQAMETRDHEPRCELIAPLDCLLWDRRLIRALFDYEYTWEIYTPPEKRRYGYYVLPLLYGEDFVGRVEAVADRKTQTLLVKNIWYEAGIKQTKALELAVDKCLSRLARFNGFRELSRGA